MDRVVQGTSLILSRFHIAHNDGSQGPSLDHSDTTVRAVSVCLQTNANQLPLVFLTFSLMDAFPLLPVFGWAFLTLARAAAERQRAAQSLRAGSFLRSDRART